MSRDPRVCSKPKAKKMSKRDRRAVVWSRWLWAVGAAACVLGRSEESVRQEFNSYVSGANQCIDATECAVAGADCPLGCFVAVRTDRKADVEEKGRRLVAEYERGGTRCSYDCATPEDLICLGGRCTFGHAQPPRGTGGGSSGGGGGSTGGQGGGGGSREGRTGGSDAGGGPIPNAYLSISPADGTTAVSDMGLELSIYDPTGLLDAAGVEAVRAAAVLVTWPEKTGVPAVATVNGAGGSSGATIRVTPSVSLGDRWYALAATGLPPMVIPTATLADGAAAARFQPFSHPRIRTIDVCEKSAPGSKLVVSFSEAVVYPADVTTLVGLSLAGAASPCEVYQAAPSALYLTCPGLTSSSHATISLGLGLQGASMVPLQPVAFDIEVASLPAGSCRTFHPPIP